MNIYQIDCDNAIDKIVLCESIEIALKSYKRDNPKDVIRGIRRLYSNVLIY